MRAYKQQVFISHSSGVWTSGIKAPADPGVVRLLSGTQIVSSPCVLPGGGAMGSVGSLTRALTPSWGLNPHDLVSSLSLPSHPTTLGVRFEHRDLGGRTLSAHSRGRKYHRTVSLDHSRNISVRGQGMSCGFTHI